MTLVTMLASNFPRSKERGLIEAVSWGNGWGSLTGFPRSKERGLIEARLWIRCTRTYVAPFRVRKSAASLKLQHCQHLWRCRQHFPRSKERGLIEAVLSDGYNALGRILSAFERARPH